MPDADTLIVASFITTNNCNDDQQVVWGMFQSESAFDLWRGEQEEAIAMWNYDTSGAASLRHGSCSRYNLYQLGQLSVGDFATMPLPMFMTIMDALRQNDAS